MLLLPVQMQSPGSSPPLLPPSQPQTSQEIKEALQAPAVNVHLLTMALQFGLSIHSLDFKVTKGSQGGLLGLLETQYPHSQPFSSTSRMHCIH